MTGNADLMRLERERGDVPVLRKPLDLRLVDDASVPSRDDTVVTWGSTSGPYEPGVPIGRITEVYSSLREASQRAVVEPFVDFSSLDVVGVMVPSGSESDRALVEADGTLR